MSHISDSVRRLAPGAAAHAGALSVLPLLGKDEPAVDYLTLDEALSRQSFEVTEVSAGGSVPELMVVNRGDLPVLLLDGELLVGAKQNRILNLTILVKAHSELKIPVSCVESGRWSYQSDRFTTSKSAAFASMRAEKLSDVTLALRRSGERRSDQGKVWQAVDRVMGDVGVASPSSNLEQAFQSKEVDLDRFERSLPDLEDQRGALFAVGSRVVGMDLFDRAASFRKYRAKLVRSYGLELLGSSGRRNGEFSEETGGAFLDRLSRAEILKYPAVGMGEDLRLTGPGLAGAALTLAEGIVHLCAFSQGEQARESHESPIAPPSHRRRPLN